MFLTPADLQRLTGKVRYSAQRRALDQLGIRYTPAETTGIPLVDVDDLPYANESKSARTRRESRPVAAMPKEPPYLSMAEIAQTRRFYLRGHGLIGCGVYFLFLGGELLYIGKSVDISARLWGHFMARVDTPRSFIPFNEWAEIAVPELWVLEVERNYIVREQPRFNRRWVN